MNFKTTIVLLVALVAVGIFFVVSNKSQTPPAAPVAITPGQGPKLLDLQSSQIKGITITDGDGNRTSVRQEGAGWKMTDPVTSPAVDWQTQELIRTICDLWSEGQPDSVPSGSGLDKPSYTVDLVGADGKETRLVIGSKTGSGDVMYAKVDGGDVNLIDSSLAKTLKTAPDDLRDKHLLTANSSDIKQISITTPTGTLEMKKNGDQWLITKPAQVPGDSESISSLASTIVGTEATEFVKSDSDELPFARFEHPTMSVWISTESPTTRPTTEPAIEPRGGSTLVIGAPDSLTDEHYFVRTSDGLIGKIAKSSLDGLRKTPLDLRDRDVVTVGASDVSQVSVVKTVYPPLSAAQATQPSMMGNQRPLSTHLVVLARRPKQVPVVGPKLATSRPATQPVQSTWIFTVPSEPNGAVDDSKVDALLGKFSPLRGDKFLETAPQGAWDQKFIVTLETKSLNKYHIEVIRLPNGQTPYATYNGLIFEVPASLLDSLDPDFHKTP